MVLIYIETYNVGAGSWQNLYYDLQKGELIEEITNTMSEDMTTKDKTFKVNKEHHLFENAVPNDIIFNTLNSNESNW